MTALGIDIGGTRVKVAAINGADVTVSMSMPYASPSITELASAVQIAAAPCIKERSFDAVGVCVPGVVNESTGFVTASVNLPTLIGVDPLRWALQAAGVQIHHRLRVTDAHAAAFAWYQRDRFEGRLAAISLGTGVGLSVLDRGCPLRVSGASPGHLGQCDVSLDDRAPIGPDGGRGSLEAYIGLRALRVRFGDRVAEAIESMTPDDQAVRALARAIRIVHSMYRPQRIVLLGGIGCALAHLGESISAMVSQDLTSLARDGWTLEFGDSPYLASIGAAHLALEHARSQD